MAASVSGQAYEIHSFLDGVGQPRYRGSVQVAELWAEISTSSAAYAFATLLGALWGSFGNVCIYRMPPSEEHPYGRSVVKPGSHCFACGNDVRWYDNVPLLSFLWLRGACRDCKATFSPRYLLVEAATALLFLGIYHYVVAVAYLHDPPAEQLVRFGVLAAFSWTMVVIAFIDLDHQLILDKISYPAIAVFYGLGLLLPGHSWRHGLIGVAFGYGIVRLISDGYFLLTKREGLGYGDGKLLAIAGALFGWQGVLVSLFFGSMLGTFILLPWLSIRGLRARAKETEDEPEIGEIRTVGQMAVPFGPFLSAAAIIYLFSESYLRVRFWLFWDFWS